MANNNNNNSPQQPPRRRARKPSGKFEGDGAGLNTAWEPTELAETVKEKEVKYSVQTKISGTSDPTAGKYAKKGKVRPTFGNVTTTHN